MVDSSEQVLDKITVDLYNKKVVMRGSEGSRVVFKCSSVTEMIHLMNECKRLLKVDNVIVR
jgi:hypothetical protein